MTKFQSPATNIALFARQDSIQHSYLQQLIDWAEGTFHYPFGTLMGQHTLAAFRAEPQSEVDPYDANHVVGIYRKGETEFGDRYTKEILLDMEGVGYNISEIGLMPPQSVIIQGVPELLGLYVKEAG